VTYIYSTPRGDRLILGASDASRRLCMPVSQRVFELCASLSAAQQAQLLHVLNTVIPSSIEAVCQGMTGRRFEAREEEEREERDAHESAPEP
jgi:hypothetical protein